MKDRLLTHIVWFTPEYAPHVKGSQFYEQLIDRIVDVEKWDSKILIDIEYFEKLIYDNYELATAYIDLYSKTAKFILLPFEIEKVDYQFYCMVDRKEIIMIFFRKCQ
jgi:hypothetical protein